VSKSRGIALKVQTIAALSGLILLSGCASDSTHSNGQSVADRGDVPLGSYIKRKPGGRDDRVTADKQALENDRTMNNGSINMPQR
jgi:hypothetical protein